MDRVNNNHSSDFISAGTEEGYYSARNFISSSKEHPATRSVSLPLSALNPHIVPFFFIFTYFTVKPISLLLSSLFL